MESYYKILRKTELVKPFEEMTVGELQNYLHYAAETDEEVIELIVFERIMRKINNRSLDYKPNE